VEHGLDRADALLQVGGAPHGAAEAGPSLLTEPRCAGEKRERRQGPGVSFAEEIVAGVAGPKAVGCDRLAEGPRKVRRGRYQSDVTKPTFRDIGLQGVWQGSLA